jgi:hypothetical protein
VTTCSELQGRVLKFDGFLKVYEETADEDLKPAEGRRRYYATSADSGRNPAGSGDQSEAALHRTASTLHGSVAGKDFGREGHWTAVDIRHDSHHDPGSRIRPERSGESSDLPNLGRS